MRSISSGAKRTTRSVPARPAARRGTPLTRIRLRPADPVAPGPDDRDLDRVGPDHALDPGEVRPPADQLGVGVRPVRAAPGEQDDRLEQAGLAGRVRAPDEVGARAERASSARSPGGRAGGSSRAGVVRVAGLRRAGPPGPGGRLGGGPDGHDHVDVVVVADRPEHARRERPVELEGELVGGDVGQDVREVARVERDRRPVALDRGLDLARRGRRPRRWR